MDISKWLPSLPTGIDGKPLHPDRISTLQKILLDEFGENASLESVERLKSKKNIVVHLKIQAGKPIDVVAKLFVVEKFDIELRILKSSWEKGLAVPKVIDADKGVILMDFISGNLLVDSLNQSFRPEFVDMLAEWYYNYHSAHDMIKGDPRLRNFIHHNGQIYGVDFEESRSADWMLDIGGTAASLLDTNPIFDVRKRRLCWRFLNQYLTLKKQKRTEEINQNFIATVADTMKQTSEWRENSEILKLSENIRQNGIPTD
ncbi:MAG: RIO1 family regulatory kinase/ATPase domain-containing protein [Candidatus Thorarchaeota archaeon]|jgi:tRNA A-37 threonylcarbamoyl transferase component Bud32